MVLLALLLLAKHDFGVEIEALVLQVGGQRGGRCGGGIGLVQVLDALVQVVLDGGEGRHDGGGAEAVGDHGEVGEVALYAGVEDGLGPGVAQGRPVLVQQVHQLLRDHSGKGNKVLKLVIQFKEDNYNCTYIRNITYSPLKLYNHLTVYSIHNTYCLVIVK